MKRRGAAILVWALLLAIAALIVVRARYSADLSAFLPRAPTPSQRLLVQQLRQGVASRLIIVAIGGADQAARARLSQGLARRLRAQPRFVSVENGDRASARRDQAFLFAHRYLLSDTVTAQRFTVAGLRAAIGSTIDMLASPAGLLAESLVPSDPTGEMMTLIGQLGQRQPPRTLDGVWASREGKLALLIVQTRAAGSDTDGQERAMNAIRGAFGAALAAQRVRASLRMTGPGVFAVEARSHIERQVTRLSIVSSVLILTLLMLVYRSVPPVLLGLLPVASAALAGIAAVALGFGVVQGVTLGFGVTLIGEGVDYSIYLFVQSRSRAGAGSAGAPVPAAAWAGIWPTIRLGMLTSVFGFASLLPSGFPGLAQLGLYSLTGVLAAGLATRFVLPALLPQDFMIRDLSPIGRAAQRLLQRVSAGGVIVGGVALASALVLYLHRDRLFSHELSALSPVPEAAQQLDGKLRGDLGAPDVRYLVVVSAADRQAALRGAEEVGTELQRLIARNVISGFQSPALYLPSRAVQLARRRSLPPAAVLQVSLKQALAGLALRASRLGPFLKDVQAARRGPLLTRQDLAGTSFAPLVDALLVHEGTRWHALLPLDAPTSGPHAFAIDYAQVRQAVSAAAPARATVLDLKGQANALYETYLHEAMRLSLLGLAAITVLLLVALRSPSRVARILLPLAAAVLTVAAGLTLFGQRLTLLHVIGMLLIVAVGSNYALFFDRPHERDTQETALTLASLLVANCATVLGFGVIAFSTVPVLRDLGATVAPGAFLALVFAALLARGARPVRK
ncbi:MAG: MMPL family transporter [Proteobacteria bacterium]|nr:MMPL family transporter [Pseudomonadota bacterium]